MSEKQTWSEVGNNIKYSVKNNKMLITLDLKQEHGMSSSGKNMKVANSGGFQKVDCDLDGAKLNLILIKTPKE